jgi:hypothetical protein
MIPATIHRPPRRGGPCGRPDGDGRRGGNGRPDGRRPSASARPTRPRPCRRAGWLAACLLLFAVLPALAQSGGGYDLTWNTVDGGGASFSTGGGYSLGGTAGQPDAGLMQGGAYTLAGGFWPGGAATAPEDRIYVPLVMRSHP